MPVTATVLSLVCHGAVVTAMVVAAHIWSTPPTKTYVVNLVPAVAAVGTPQGRASQPPRPEETPPRANRREPSEAPVRETPRPPAPAPELPARSAALPDPPARASAPALPDRALPERTLPDRPLPPRPPTASRPGDKELPAVASTTPSPAPPAPAPATTARSEPAPPPAPLGRASGSAQGSGAMTLNVTDFPFAWYLAAVQRKITERWEDRAQPGRQPVVTFVIGRDGQVSSVTLKDSSGNAYYDRAAIRAIAEAAPFPQLPSEFPGSELRIHLGFNFARDRG
jgi:protein TonB